MLAGGLTCSFPRSVLLFTFTFTYLLLLIFPPSDGQQDAPPGYRGQSGKRCSGGTSVRVGEPGQGVAACASICDASPDCYGFNLRLADRSCVARSSGCSSENDDGSVFYLKTGQQQPRVPQQPGPSDPSGSGYVITNGMRCTGEPDSKIGETMNDLERCKAVCDSRPDCYVINWRAAQSVCVVRTVDCAKEADPATQLYQKTAGSSEQQPATRRPTPAPTTTQRSQQDYYTEAQDSSIPIVPKYIVMANKACTQATQIGQSQVDTRQCALVCDRQANCQGYTFFPRQQICTAHTFECTVQSDSNGALFYRKKVAPPSRTSQIQPVSPSMTQRPPSDVRTGPSNSGGFDKKESVRCSYGTSTRLGDIQTDYTYCSVLCLSNPDCAGFNVERDGGNCAMRSSGCAELQDDGYTYYRKQNTVISQPKTTPSNSQNSESDFEVTPGTRCVGGTSSSLGMYLGGLAECSRACKSDPSCYGFNFVSETNSCTVRSAGCNLQPTDGMSFYRRRR